MDEQFKKLIQDMKKVKLTDEEKAETRSFLKYFVKNNPIKEGKVLFPFMQVFARPIPTMAVIILLIGVSVSFAAENSLPNDLLYPVKTSVNENVLKILARDEESKVKLETRFVRRRLEEAKELVANNKLDNKAQNEISLRIREHTNTVNEYLSSSSEIETEVAAEVGSDLESYFGAQEKILSNIPDHSEIEPIIETIKVQKTKISQTREENEQKTILKSKTEIRIINEDRIEKAEKNLEELKKDGNATQKQLDEIEEIIEEGRDKLENDLQEEAFIDFQKVNRTTQEIKLLIESDLSR